MRYRHVIGVLLWTTIACGGTAESIGDDEQALAKQWLEVYDEIAESFEVSAIGIDSDLQRRTILTIYNPVFQTRHGKVYLWTDDGRPVIVSSVMSVVGRSETPPLRYVNYEFHSLSPQAVRAGKDGKVFWRSEVPGIDWIDRPKREPISTSRVGRLIQMRSIARSYAAEAGRKFRLMPQPLYRYPKNTPGVTDGAIFSYSLFTDPCVYLLVEAKAGSWRVAFARSNRNPLVVKMGESTIWSAKAIKNRNSVQTGAFYLLWHAERRPVGEPHRILHAAWDR